jgi:O-antigen ligase
VGILLGAWGMLQWFGHFSFGAAGDVGVRAGVRLTSAGSGQLQGGEYGFPVVVTVAIAVLLFGGVRSTRARAALWVAIVLNAAACLVTFERTFWLSTLLGVAFVVLRAPAPRRLKAVLAAPVIVVVAVTVLGAVAPATLTTARERVLSLGQYSSDDSVRYRVVESEFVLAQIRAHPLTGSGLAAEIFWGQPWAQGPAKTYAFSHNGYLWLAWKLGIPAAVLLVLVIGCAILLRAPPGDDLLSAGVRRGAEGALLGLLLATITFPSFNVLSITPAMGVLLALAIVRRPVGGR